LPTYPFPETILYAATHLQVAEWRHGMAKVKQLTISLENRPGALSQMAQTLADAKINVIALLDSSAGVQGSPQLVVDDIRKAKKALDKAGMSYTEGTLEQFELNNKPGALAEVAGKLAKRASISTLPTPPCPREQRRQCF
jgi:prephenate dehydratase